MGKKRFSRRTARAHGVQAWNEFEVIDFYINIAAKDIKILTGRVENPNCKKQLQNIYEEIKSSPKVSAFSVREYEKEIARQIQFITYAVNHKQDDKMKNYIPVLQDLLQQRNKELQKKIQLQK